MCVLININLQSLDKLRCQWVNSNAIVINGELRK